MRSRLRLQALVVGALLVGLAIPAPVFALTATTTTLSFSLSTARLDQQVTGTITVGPTPYNGYGRVTLWQVLEDDTRVNVRQWTFPYNQPTIEFEAPREFGSSTFVAVFSRDTAYGLEGSESALAELTYTEGQPWLEIYRSAATVEQHTPFFIDIGLATWGETGGTVDVFRVGSATPLCSMPRSTEPLRCNVTSSLPIGVQEFYATYSGTATWFPAQSIANVAVTITADVVHATAAAPQYTTFYPVKDGYRDTVKLSGSGSEEINGTVKIYGPSGSLVKTFTLPSLTLGYSFIWPGRNSAGTILAEGKYKVVHALRDAWNNTKTVTQYVTLSKKKLIWHSASITKNGSAFSASGKQGTGSVTVNTTSGWVRLRSYDPYTTWAGAGWQFTLATGVSYRSIAVQVYAKHGFSSGYQRMGSQDFAKCAYTATGDWSEGCFNTWKSLAGSNGVLAWTNTGTLTASHRSGTKVRSMVSVASGDVYVYKARVTYQYATLGY